ncbi:ROK family protein [Brachybacterium sp. J144]|uniref:ROK family transcriptional regulator n=1 Tax=Brachybacterium sp. J144 TaxID=3116487 RepID=UPI002E75D9B1|nr:ROK family protein [Brachybacterium sp. J144]MEE1652057.1 ROK family protein [Brachybacterium sp. J144]
MGEDRSTAEIRQASTRRAHLALREAEQPLSIAELVAATGLSRPTVLIVVEDLAARGLVIPAAPAEEPGPGRPARRLRLAPDAAHVAGLDIGARSVRTVRADLAGTVLARGTVALDPEDLLGSLRRALGEIDAGADAGPLGAVGLSVPGLLTADGSVGSSLALPALAGRDLARELAEELGAPVVLENDVKLAALAEHRLGAEADGPAADGLVLLRIGHRISVAITVHGRILQGAYRLAGELGTQRGMRWTASSRRGRLVWSTGDEARPLLERAARGDADAQQEIRAFCEEIAPRLAGLLLAVDPEIVVVGGGLSRAGETLLAPLREALELQLLGPGRPRLVPAALPADGSLVGALGRAFEHGSTDLVGVPDVPAPWERIRRTLHPDPLTPDPQTSTDHEGRR